MEVLYRARCRKQAAIIRRARTAFVIWRSSVKLILQYFAAVCCNCGVRLRSNSGVVHYWERERVRVPHGSLIIAPSYPVLPPLTSYKQRKSKMGNAGFRFSKNTEEDEKVIPDDHWNCPKIEEIFLLLMTFDVVKMIQRWYKDDTTMIQMN